MTGPPVDWVIAALIAVVTYLAYRWTDGPRVLHQSNQPHFVLLADAFLHGHLWIDPTRAARLGDVTEVAGRYYVAFPPLPAILMLPFVAVSGPGFDDVAFSVALGAVNVSLAYLLVRRLAFPGFLGDGIPLGRIEALAVAALLAVGTVHWYAALAGTVWFIAHTVSVTFLLLYLLECAGAGRPLVAGAALAAAFLARTPTIFGLTLWLVFAYRRRKDVRAIIARTCALGVPLALAVALLLVQNIVRFGSPLDFGYLQMRVSTVLAPDLKRYGQFNLRFLSRNLVALLLTPPVVHWEGITSWLNAAGSVWGMLRQMVEGSRPPGGIFPIEFNPWGTGVWAVSPVLGFAARPPSARYAALYAAGWLSAFVVALPDLLYYNTGWVQYGYRFSLDFTPFLLVLTALGLRRPLHPGWRVLYAVLLVVSATSNFLGARWFLGLPPY